MTIYIHTDSHFQDQPNKAVIPVQTEKRWVLYKSTYLNKQKNSLVTVLGRFVFSKGQGWPRQLLPGREICSASLVPC